MSQVFSDGHRPQVGRGAGRRNRAIARIGLRHSLTTHTVLHSCFAVFTRLLRVATPVAYDSFSSPSCIHIFISGTKAKQISAETIEAIAIDQNTSP